MIVNVVNTESVAQPRSRPRIRRSLSRRPTRDRSRPRREAAAAARAACVIRSAAVGSALAMRTIRAGTIPMARWGERGGAARATPPRSRLVGARRKGQSQGGAYL